MLHSYTIFAASTIQFYTTQTILLTIYYLYLLQDHPMALYVHCHTHGLNLANSDTYKEVKMMRDTVDFANEICKTIKRSPKKDAMLQKIKDEIKYSDDSESATCGGLHKFSYTRFVL